MANETREEIRIAAERDIVAVRKAVRDAAVTLGFSVTDTTRIVTAASELARNVFRYAGTGQMSWQRIERDGRVGIRLKFLDHGPGIADVDQAMTPGYTSGGGLGMGLPGSKRLSDEMEIHSVVGKGTAVAIVKWLPR